MKYLLYIFIFLLAAESQSQIYTYWLKDDWVIKPTLFKPNSSNPFIVYDLDFFMTDSHNGLLRDETDQFTTILKVDDRGNSLNLIFSDKRIWKNGNEIVYSPPVPSRLFVKNDLAICGTYNYTDPYYNYFSTDSGMVWLSIDTGNTWNRYFTDLKDGIMDTKILDDGTIIVLSGTRIAVSRDTCKSWSYSEKFPTRLYDTIYTPLISFGDTVDIISTIYEANVIECIDTNNVYVFAQRNTKGLPNKMVASSDGGKTWKLSELPGRLLRLDNYEISFTVTADNKIWVAGHHKKVNENGELAKLRSIFIDYSTDYGDTWINSLDTILEGHAPGPDLYSPDRPVRKIKFYDSQNGIVVGDSGYFFRTDDGGESWHYEGREGEMPAGSWRGNFYNFDYLAKDTIILFSSKGQTNFLIAPLHPIVHPDVSVTDMNNHSISIYPNPAGDFINITIDNDEGLFTREVQILDLLGLVVSKQELTDGNNRIDISDLPRGAYFIKVGDKVEKFVKM